MKLLTAFVLMSFTRGAMAKPVEYECKGKTKTSRVQLYAKRPSLKSEKLNVEFRYYPLKHKLVFPIKYVYSAFAVENYDEKATVIEFETKEKDFSMKLSTIGAKGKSSMSHKDKLITLSCSEIVAE